MPFLASQALFEIVQQLPLAILSTASANFSARFTVLSDTLYCSAIRFAVYGTGTFCPVSIFEY